MIARVNDEELNLKLYEIHKCNPSIYKGVFLGECDFSNRTSNCLKRQGIFTLCDLLNCSTQEIMNFRNMGTKSVNEILNFLDNEIIIEKKQQSYNVIKLPTFVRQNKEQIINKNFSFFDSCNEDVKKCINIYKKGFEILEDHLAKECVENTEMMMHLSASLLKISDEVIIKSKSTSVFKKLPEYRKENPAKWYVDVYNEQFNKSNSIPECDENITVSDYFKENINKNDIIKPLFDFISWLNFDFVAEFNELIEKLNAKSDLFEIISLRSKHKTLDEIGKLKGVTRQRIRQKEETAIRLCEKWRNQKKPLYKIFADRCGNSVVARTDIFEYFGDYTDEIIYIVNRSKIDTVYDKKLELFICGEKPKKIITNEYSNSYYAKNEYIERQEEVSIDKEIKKTSIENIGSSTEEERKVSTQERKLKNRILREFKKKSLLGDIQISDDEFDILIEYLKEKYKYMKASRQHIVIDPVLCVALVQIGIRYYDKAYWPHVRRMLDGEKINANNQGWIGTSFVETLKQCGKLQVENNDNVDNILMHSFVSNVFAEKFFDFLYAFYKIDLDRDINRLDKETMNELIEIIQKNDNTGRTYFLVEHTADAVRKNIKGAKIRIRRYLKLIDKAFWGEPLPLSSSNRLMQLFLTWKDNDAEFVKEKTTHGGKGKRGKKSYASPHIKYFEKNEKFKLVLPSQIIRFNDFTNITWNIESVHYSENIEINPYAQGVTGYKTDPLEIEIKKEGLFDNFSISLMDGDEKLRTFRIAKEEIRFFDLEGDYIRNDAIPQGQVYSFTKKGVKPESEAIIECFDNDVLVMTEYDFVNGDIIRISNEKPISIGGKIEEGIMNRGSVSEVFAGNFGNRIPVYKIIPEVFVKMLPSRIIGTAIKINNQTYHFASEKGVAPGITEFDLMDRTGEKGYLIRLDKFGCREDGKYNVSIDVPNDRTNRQWKFMLIKDLEFEFDGSPYIFKSRGTISLPRELKFESKGNIHKELRERSRFTFDIQPGESYFILEYLGIDINFEIPTLSYKFNGEEWHNAPHVDIWHSDFNPKLYIKYNADVIQIFLDDEGYDEDYEEDDEKDTEEHIKKITKNKSKGLFECDLNIFKSWFGRENVSRQIFLKLPDCDEPIPFVRVVTKSIFNSGLLKADFENEELVGEFDIIGQSEYFVDIEFDKNKIVEKAKQKNKQLRIPSELKTGMYKVTVYESEEDESGFGDSIFYEIGSFITELLNPKNLSNTSIEITMIHLAEDKTSYLPLSACYQIVDLKHKDCENLQIYQGKMIVAKKPFVLATFPVLVDFFDLEKLRKSHITFVDDEDDSGAAFLYDDYKRVIVKQEDKSLGKTIAYSRYKNSLYPEDYVFEIKFIERPENADDEKNDELYNNLRKENIVESMMSESIFKK